MTVHNGERHLAESLCALETQEWPAECEVVVVDNGSTDRSRQIAESFVGRLPLRIIDASEEIGHAAALNAGIAAARSDHLVFLDHDDVVAPGYVVAMHQALSNHPFVAARIDYVSLNPEWARRHIPPRQGDGIPTLLGFLPAASGCSLGVWREVFLRVGLFAQEVAPGQDVDLCWRAQFGGFPLVLVPAAVLRYRFRTDLWAIFQQRRGYGRAHPRLYRRYRELGMTRRSARSAVAAWGAIIVRLVRVRSRADFAAWIGLAGEKLGVLEGCWAARVLYL